MKNILRFFLVISTLLTPFYVFSSERTGGRKPVLSFSSWKTEKIQSAKEQVDRTKLRIKTLKKTSNSVQSKEIVQLKQQLNQHEFNLEVAKGLAITDYVALYLSTQEHHNTALHKAAQQMTAQEVSQVLKAYLSSIKNDDGGAGSVDSVKLPRYSKDTTD